MSPGTESNIDRDTEAPRGSQSGPSPDPRGGRRPQSDAPPTPSGQMIAALGRLSTHPAFLAWRLRMLRRIALVPLIAAGIYFVFRAWQAWRPLPSGNWGEIALALVPLIKSVFSVAPIVVLAFACTIAMGFASLLTLRASISPYHAAPSQSTRISWLLLLAGVALSIFMGAGAAWAAQTPLLETATRWWIVAGALVPLYLMMAVLEWSERDLGSTDSGRLFFILRWAVLAPAAIATVALTLPATSGWVAAKAFGLLTAGADLLGLGGLGSFLRAFVEKQLETITTQVVGLFVALGVLFALSFRIRALERRLAAEITGDAADPQTDDTQEQPRRGCMARLFALTGIPFLLKLFRGGDDAKEHEAPSAAALAGMPKPPPPEWFEKVTADAASNGITLELNWHAGEEGDAAGGASSPRIPETNLAWLFNGLDPSSDQLALFEAFQDRWAEHLRAIEEARYGADRESHADLLVEAEDGSGVDDAIAACAVFATVARGQRVLLLVRNRVAQDATVDAMRQRLQRFGFDTLYVVAPLRRESVSEWCAPSSDPSASTTGDPPDIAIATLEDYETVFFSGAFATDQLRAFQRSLEVVIVPHADKQLEELASRNHLPFTLDKHRLILRTENRAMQLVITVDPMGGRPTTIDKTKKAARIRATTARRALAMRLFGGDGGLDAALEGTAPELEEARRNAHLAYLRPVVQRASPILEVQVDAAQHRDASIWILQRLQRDRGGFALLFNGDRPRKASERPAVGRGYIASTSTFATDRKYLHGRRWVLGANRFDGADAQAASRLTAYVQGATLVLVTSVPVVREPAPARTPPVFPVFPSPMSPGLFIAHLRSAATALTPDVPTRREDLARFGLAWDERYWSNLASTTLPEIVSQSWRLELDGELRDIVRREDRVWPAVFLRSDDTISPAPIDVSQPLESSYCLVPEGKVLRIGRLPHAIDRRRFATWMTRRGLELGRSDLAYFQPVLFQGSRQAFRAIDLESTADGTIVLADSLSIDGGDLVLPIRQSRFTLPTDARLSNPRTLRALNAFLFDMKEAGTPCVAHDRIVALATVGDTSSTTDRRSIPPVEFSMHVGITVLAIAGRIPTEDYETTLRARYEGAWDTSIFTAGAPRARDSWHALSRAVTYAIGEVAPTLLRFANAYAFRPPRDQAGATILFVEPAATQGTAIDALSTILDDTELRERFLEALERAAREGLRSRESMRIDGDESEIPTESTAELLEIIALLRRAPVAPSEAEIDSAHREAAVIEPPELSAALERWTPQRREPQTIPADANQRWHDINAVPIEDWIESGLDSRSKAPEYGVKNDLAESIALAETAAFGLHSGLNFDDVEALRAASVFVERTAEGVRLVRADYKEMLKKSTSSVSEIANRLLAIADSTGLKSTRDRIGLFASFVQSFEYVPQRDGDVKDGRDRMGVQMPTATLYARMGDCDSLSLLLVALLRAANVARAGLVLIEEPDGGHMMVAVQCPGAAGDLRLRTKMDRLILIESTSPWPLGRGSSDYEGRHVRFLDCPV
jgi:hypothetical protein